MGQCRRHPPVLVPGREEWSLASEITHWPETLARDWCGEHVPVLEGVGI